MATPPRSDPDRVVAALQAIARRHADRDAPYLEDLGEGPDEVLEHLRRHAGAFSQGLRADDLDDVAVLLLDEWWRHERRMLFWLEQVVRLGASRTDFAHVFGVRSRQGFKDWYDRLHQLFDEFGSGRPDEQAARAARADEAAAAAAAGSEREWLAAHREEYVAIAREAVGLYMDVDEDTAGYLLEVRRDLKAPEAYGEAQVAELAVAVDALRECMVPGLQERIGRVVAHWSDLQGKRREASESW